MRRGPAIGEDRERRVVMAQTCFLTNAGVGPAMPKTIDIRAREKRS
jgi:hypothetical protein